MILFLEKPINSELMVSYKLNYPHVLTYEEEINDSSRSKVLGLYTEVGHKLDNFFLSEFINLKFIATPTTSLTHIDLEYCQKFNIKIFSLKNHKSLIKDFTATAEVAWWHILELQRKLSLAQTSVIAGEWNRRKHLTNTLAGKTLGIIGFGRLGQRLARIAEIFEMSIYYFDLDVKVSVDKNMYSHATSIDEIFLKSDIISINVDDRPDNVNLINSNHFNLIRNPGVILINTARGFVLNEKEALEALRSGQLGGLGLDVLQDEEVSERNSNWLSSNLIWKAKTGSNMNITLTPHVGGATVETLNIASKAVLDDLYFAVSASVS